MANYTPFPPRTPLRKLLQMIVEKKPRLPKSKGSRLMSDFVDELLCIDENKRPTAAVALQHDWLMSSGTKETEWAKIVAKAREKTGNCSIQ